MLPYNNVYNNPYQLQNPLQTIPQQQIQPFSNQNTNILWVQGIEGAKAYPVPAGGAVSLWDTEHNSVYVKIVDASGVPQPIRIFDYTERVEPQESLDNGCNYITEEKLNQILDEKFASFASNLSANDSNETKKNATQRGGRGNAK